MPDTIPFGSPPIQPVSSNNQQPAVIPFGSAPISSQAAPTPPTVPATPSEGFGGFVGRTLNSLEQPFINVAATGAQLAAQAGYSLGGGKGTINIFPQGVNPNRSLTTEPVPVSSVAAPEGWLQKAGSVGQIAATALGAGTTGVLGNAAVGAGMGLSQSLQGGEQDPHQLVKDTLYGGLFGAGVGLLSNFLKMAGNLEQAKTGVIGQVQREISQTDPSLLKQYIDATTQHAEDIRIPSPDAIAENTLRNRASLLVDKAIPEAGQAVGAAKQAAAEAPVVFQSGNAPAVSGSEAVNAVTDQVNEVMQRLTGHQLTSYGGGEVSPLTINYPEGASTAGIQAVEGAVQKLPGRAVELSAAETRQLEAVDRYLKTLAENPTVQTASDMVTNLDNDIGKWSTPVYGAASGNTPVEGVLRYARGAISRIISPASPDIAAANARYSTLMDLKNAIGVEAGNVGQNASLMMRRVLSGDQSNDVIPILDQLDQVVKPYLPASDQSNLVQHAILASWAKNTFGDPTTKTLINQYINRDVNAASSIFGYPRQFMQKTLGSIFGAFSPDAAKFAMSVANSSPQSMNPLVRGLDALVESGKGVEMVNKFAASLRGVGITGPNVEKVAKTLFKVWLLQKLSQPKQPAPPQSGPTSFLPASTGRTLSQ